MLLIAVGVICAYDIIHGRDRTKKLLKKWNVPLKYWQITLILLLLVPFLLAIIILL